MQNRCVGIVIENEQSEENKRGAEERRGGGERKREKRESVL